MIDRIVIATGNPGKLRELDQMLGGLGIEVVAQSALGIEPGEETGDTFVANALQKARHAASLSGLPAIADDSGLVVDALDGAPGIYSARYAGPGATDEENVDKLLAALESHDHRDAFFHCAAVFVRAADDDAPIVAEASWHGSISRARSGSGGFGYDPVFFVPELDRNSAELSAAEKNTRSHRGKAVAELVRQLAASLNSGAAD